MWFFAILFFFDGSEVWIIFLFFGNVVLKAKRIKTKEESLVFVNKKSNIFQKIKNIIETIFKKHK